MRYYLDTNVLAMMVEKRMDEFAARVRELLCDYGNTLYASSVAVHELIHLLQIERVASPKSERVTAAEVLDWLDRYGITTVYVNRKHIQSYSEMPVVDGHTDPQDRLIIAQAISDRIPLVSSDLRFPKYSNVGLSHIPSR